jgi:hypothetical protein
MLQIFSFNVVFESNEKYSNFDGNEKSLVFVTVVNRAITHFLMLISKLRRGSIWSEQGTTTLSIMAFSIMKLSIKGLYETHSKSDTRHK